MGVSIPAGWRAAFGVVVVACLGLLSAAGAAWAARTVTNVYTVKAGVRPVKPGTRQHPRPIASNLEWDVASVPAGERPANVSRYAISWQGIQEHTTLFPSCAPSRLATPVPNCPRGSKIGSGFLILELGATGFSDSGYNPTCSLSLALFNGGHHDLTLFVYEGRPARGEPAECTIPGGHAAIRVNIRRSGRGIREAFRAPPKLMHPAQGLDTAVIKGVIRVPKKQKLVTRGGVRRRVGLFDSFFCPRSHQRQVAMTFTREDGGVATSSTFVSCR